MNQTFESSYIKPLLRGYTGSKFKFLSEIEPNFPPKIKTFVDMFTGGGSISANVKNADHIIVNELQTPILNFHQTEYSLSVKDIVHHLHDRITKYDLTWEGEKEYYDFRTNYIQEQNPIDLILLAPLSFSGILSFNEKGVFTNTYAKGNNKTGEILTPTFINDIVRYKKQTEKQKRSFINGSFKDFPIDTLTPGDFVYCDPPYFATKAKYNKFWGENELKGLINMFQYLIDHDVWFGYSDMLCVNDEVNYEVASFIKRNKEKLRMKQINSDYSNALDKRTKETSGKYIEIYLTNYLS